jgi:hypothetical protein
LSTRPLRTRVLRPPWPQLELFAVAPTLAVLEPAVTASAPVSTVERWSFTRPWLVSPHLPRARRELDAVRAHFPELDAVTVRVGLTKRRGILGLASLGDEPMIWIRPRRIRRFAIAHELVHLLQARGLAPGGEMSADLHALARSSSYADAAPFYLRVPRAFLDADDRELLAAGAAAELHALARAAVERARGAKTARGAIAWFHGEARRAAAAFARRRPEP